MDDYFRLSIQDSWETFMNGSSDISNQTSCLLAKYCDDLLRQSKSVQLSDEDIATQLDRVLSVFKFLHAKDFFKVRFFVGGLHALTFAYVEIYMH